SVFTTEVVTVAVFSAGSLHDAASSVSHRSLIVIAVPHGGPEDQSVRDGYAVDGLLPAVATTGRTRLGLLLQRIDDRHPGVARAEQRSGGIGVDDNSRRALRPGVGVGPVLQHLGGVVLPEDVAVAFSALEAALAGRRK